MNKTKIEYLTHTWNPIAMRCTPVSEGCANCWHLRRATMLAGNKNFPPEVRAAYAGEGPPVLVEKRLNSPLNVKKPAVVGVQFMGDLFHDDVDENHLYSVWQIMLRANWHTFLVLTKRPEWMSDYVGLLYDTLWNHTAPANIWLGVSVENSDYLWRVEELMRCPAAVRFVSLEPLLGPIQIPAWQFCERHEGGEQPDGTFIVPSCRIGINWVIVGGESGPGARPMHPDWVRSIRDQCQAAGVPFYFKQWGAWQPGQEMDEPFGPAEIGERCIEHNGRWCRMYRVGKKAAGRLLDGQLWNETPWNSEGAESGSSDSPTD